MLLSFAVTAPAAATSVLTDPLGDFYLIADPYPAAAPAIPDIIELSVGYTATDLIVSAGFAPGTLVPGTPEYFLTLSLDLDLDSSTGNGWVPGAEKVLLLASSQTYGTLCDNLVPVPTGCGGQLAVDAQPDSLSVSIPLDANWLDDDGVVRFGFDSGVIWEGVAVGGDSAYDGTASTTPDFTVQSTPVPEPHTGLLLWTGLVAALGSRRRRTWTGMTFSAPWLHVGVWPGCDD